MHISYIICIFLIKYGNVDAKFKLPLIAEPKKYHLTIEPHLNPIGPSTFVGNVTIEFTALDNTNHLILHSRNLSISKKNIFIKHKKRSDISVLDISTNLEDEYIILHFNENLNVGEDYNLSVVNFHGNLSLDVNVGFYLGQYQDGSKNAKLFAITDFEPTDARRAFPCFDQPNFKTEFQISLIRQKNYSSASNEELDYTTNLGDNRFKDTFKLTQKMPTYLVAFMVSDFAYVLPSDSNRIYGRPELVESGRLNYSATVTIEVLRVLEEWFDINHGLKKTDQVAVPKPYYEAEAMENWGLVTYKEEHLSYSEGSSTTEDLQRITAYIAHELSHQWFGNLVTPRSWRDIWLGEGFAAYFQYFATSKWMENMLGAKTLPKKMIRPTWSMEDQFVIDVFHKILDFDDVTNKESVSQEFFRDTLPSPWIFYYKSSSIIRMTQHFLTTDVFGQGLRIYLENNKFASTEPEDLFEAFQEAADRSSVDHLFGDRNVSTILKSWNDNYGYPLVTAYWNTSSRILTVSQSPYSVRPSYRDARTLWHIPITVAVHSEDYACNYSDTSTDLWLSSKTVDMPLNTTNGCYIVNKKQVGFYRVNYDTVSWRKIVNFLRKDNNFNLVHPINRAQLVDDSFSLACAGYITYDIPLDLSEYLFKETAYIPLLAFLQKMDTIEQVVMFSDTHPIFKQYVEDLLRLAYNHHGFEEAPEDSHADKLNRIKLITWMCNHGRADCRQKAQQQLKKWMQHVDDSLPPNLQLPVLCAAMRVATPEEVEFVYNQYNQQQDKMIKDRYFEALSCTTQHNFLERLIFLCSRVSGKYTLHELIEMIIVNGKHEGYSFHLRLIDLNLNLIKSGLKKGMSLRAVFGRILKNQINFVARISAYEHDKVNFSMGIKETVRRSKDIYRWFKKYGTTKR